MVPYAAALGEMTNGRGGGGWEKNEIEIKSPGIHSVLPLYVCMRRGVFVIYFVSTVFLGN